METEYSKIKKILSNLMYVEVVDDVIDQHKFVLKIAYYFEHQLGGPKVNIIVTKSYGSENYEKVDFISVDNELELKNYQELKDLFNALKIPKKVAIHKRAYMNHMLRKDIQHSLKEIWFALNDLIIGKLEKMKLILSKIEYQEEE